MKLYYLCNGNISSLPLYIGMLKAIHSRSKLYSFIACLLLLCSGIRVTIPIIHHHTCSESNETTTSSDHAIAGTDRHGCIICLFITNLYDVGEIEVYIAPLRLCLVLLSICPLPLCAIDAIRSYHLRAPPHLL